MLPKSFPHISWNKGSSAWSQACRQIMLRWPTVWVIKIQFISIDQDRGVRHRKHLVSGITCTVYLMHLPRAGHLGVCWVCGWTVKEAFHRRLQLLSLCPWPQGLAAFCSLTVHLLWWALVAKLTFPHVWAFPASVPQESMALLLSPKASKTPRMTEKRGWGQITNCHDLYSSCSAHHHNFMCPSCIQCCILWDYKQQPHN